MTDLLLSELLVLLILLPVLLRPFSKNLKRGAAIPILPFISLFVCICTIIGQDIVLFSALLLLFVLIVCCTEIIRLVAFFQGVLNDFYGIASIIWRILLLLLFCGMVYAAFTFAPEAQNKIEQPLVIRTIDLTGIHTQDTQKQSFFEGRLIERQGGADKKALVIVTEAYLDSGYPGTIASILADQGYTVAELYRKPQRIISRVELYARVFRLIGKKEGRYLTKETAPQVNTAFSACTEAILNRYGGNKRLFLYTEGIYTALAEQFCAGHQGAFTGVFFRISAEEPLPAVPDGWMQVVQADTEDSQPELTAADAGSNTAADSAPAAGTSSESGAAAPTETAPTAQANSRAQRKADHSAAAIPAGGSPAVLAEAAPTADPPAQPALPFYCRVESPTLLPGFGSLRADDPLAAELLGSGRSLGRRDKAAAAAAFIRYALSL